MFTVEWTDYALDQLADVFVSLDLNTQDQLSKAVEVLNRRLAIDPLDEGESRNGAVPTHVCGPARHLVSGQYGQGRSPGN
jgi:hypothetical protein